YGENVSFTATPSTGYVVSKWMVDGVSYDSCGADQACELTNVTSNHTIVVNFA
ncbi:InlB B-repeat-containing protein, partial [Legionella longbeachae]|uniref:InlB B-repeat-containing protein n=1 Tax=Legionella longbeachae TaxID=450 RepID=UPI003B42F5AA